MSSRAFSPSAGPASRRMPTLVILACVALLVSQPLAAKSGGAPAVPFKGDAEEQAISAVPVDADHVFVTTVGGGNATHLGRFTFVSPHLSGLSDFSIDGDQFFTAANGDELHATLAGNLHPFVAPDGHVFLVGDIPATIVGGTGRFDEATGSFTFSIVFDTQTFHSTATIDGNIEFAGN
jgi:hypothetical protein